MYRIDSRLQELLIDPFGFLGPKRKKLLETGWSGLFRKSLLEEVPVDTIKACFSGITGRPTKELRMVSGVMILQHMFDLTDQETVSHLAFNIQWHYILDLTTEDDSTKYICERTLRNYRRKMQDLHLEDILFRVLTDKLLKAFNVPTQKQRLDSTHIHSDMKRLRRLNLFQETIRLFLREFEKKEPGQFISLLPDELIKRYQKQTSGYFGQVKPSEAKEKLDQAARDLFLLVETCKDQEPIRQWKSYKLLQRLISDQCIVVGQGEDPKIEMIEPKEVASNALQNPSDPDAGYSGHKGQGYQAQLMETFQEEDAGSGEEAGKKAIPNLVTYVDVEPANCSDSDAPARAIAETKERGCCPKELLADTAYGSDENVQKAKEEDVELIAPTMGKPKSKEEKLILDDCNFNGETGEMESCYMNKPPLQMRQTESGKWIVTFADEICQQCEAKEYCSIGQAKDHTLEYTAKQRRLAERRVQEESEEFREKYRYRSGIEGLNEKLKRKLKLGRLRVRGLARVRFAVILKVLSWNILQAAKA